MSMMQMMQIQMPYEYMNDLEDFNETTLLEQETFYRNLNIEDITDADYMHAKRVSKDFEIKHLGEYHEFYLKSDTSKSILVMFLKTLEKCG